MKPDTITTEIEIADVVFRVEIEFDRTPPVGEYDEEIDVRMIGIKIRDEYVTLWPLYIRSPEFKARIDELVKDVIHDHRPDPNAELIDSRW